MSPIVFLVVALLLAAVGSLVVVLRNRRRPGPYDELDDFARSMRVLAPDHRVDPRQRSRRR